MEQEIYFDNAATTSLYPETVERMRHFFAQEFWNPSAMYRPAIQAEKELEEARETVAAGLKVPAKKPDLHLGRNRRQYGDPRRMRVPVS